MAIVIGTAATCRPSSKLFLVLLTTTKNCTVKPKKKKKSNFKRAM